jgi:hypothetical protein
MVNEGLDTLQIFQLGCSTREAPRLSSMGGGVISFASRCKL